MSKKAPQIRIRKINKVLCMGCGICVSSCMMDVIYFDKEKEKAYIAYPEDCQACFLCVMDCAAEAITVCAAD